jgi:protein-L-isoaspartate(D-aspartate) O-methyltransferase
VAYQTELLQLKPHDKVLEIGTGSMYQASVLAEMGARVYTIERQKVLFDKTKDYFFKQKYPHLKFFYGDGYLGLPTFAPFDKILITAAAPYIPSQLVDQLKVGCKMVVPLAVDHQQRLLRISPNADGTIAEEAFSRFSFVPMLTGKNGN